MEEGGDDTTMEQEQARLRGVLTPGIMRACSKGKPDGDDVGATGDGGRLLAQMTPAAAITRSINRLDNTALDRVSARDALLILDSVMYPALKGEACRSPATGLV